jgi:hypothetical protein
MAVRKLLPEFRNIAPASLRTLIGNSGELGLEEMPMPKACQVIEMARALGLEVAAENASFISYLPYDRTSKCAWLIEDDAEALAVAEAMIAEGVPVQDVVE